MSTLPALLQDMMLPRIMSLKLSTFSVKFGSSVPLTRLRFPIENIHFYAALQTGQNKQDIKNLQYKMFIITTLTIPNLSDDAA